MTRSSQPRFTAVEGADEPPPNTAPAQVNGTWVRSPLYVRPKPAPTPGRFEAERTIGEARRQVLSDEYGQAREKLQEHASSHGLAGMRKRIGYASAAQLLTVPLLFFSADLTIFGATFIASGSFLAIAAESSIEWPLFRMRRAVSRTSARRAAQMLYEFDRAEALHDWIRNSRSSLPWLRWASERRATRAYHRAIRHAIAALQDPKSQELAEAVLTRSDAHLVELLGSDQLEWRSHHRHVQHWLDVARRSGGHRWFSFIQTEMRLSALHSRREMHQALQDPYVYRPWYSRLAAEFVEWRRLRLRDRLDLRGAFDAANAISFEPDDLLAAVPAVLRGDRAVRRRLVRTARRVVALTEAEIEGAALGLPERPTVDDQVQAVTRSVELDRALRIAEARLVQLELGERDVAHEQVVVHIERVTVLAEVSFAALDADVIALQAHAARLGVIEPVCPFMGRSQVVGMASRSTTVSPERILEIFDQAAPGCDIDLSGLAIEVPFGIDDA